MAIKFKLKIRVKRENDDGSDIVIKRKYGFSLAKFDLLTLKIYFNSSL